MRKIMPICFFCGVMFLFYDIIIFATGLFEQAHPPHPTPVLFSLHPSIWWGGFMGIAGAA